MEAVLDDPYILIVNSKVSANEDLLPLLDEVVQAGKSWSCGQQEPDIRHDSGRTPAQRRSVPDVEAMLDHPPS
jgi:hypothetical protein